MKISTTLRISRRRCPTTGVILPFFIISLVMLLAFMAYSIDLGRGWYNKVDLQKGADQGALAGLLQIQISGAGVSNNVNDLAQSNGLSTSEVTAVQCGVYNPYNRCFTACGSCVGTCARASCMSVGDEGIKINAVRVATRRSLATSFAKMVGVTRLFPTGESTAMGRFSNSAPCIAPLGVDGVSNRSPLIGVSVGNTFTLSVSGAGNWGKLDIGGNMSSGTNFENAMLNGACSPAVTIGSSVSTGTGFGGSIDHVMDQVLTTPVAGNMVIAVTTRFPNGNGTIQILEYIRVAYVGSTGNGGNWRGQFRLLERNVTPPLGGGSTGLVQRYLVSPL